MKLLGRELFCSLIGVHGRLFNLLEGVATSPVFGTLLVVLGRTIMWSLMKALCLGDLASKQKTLAFSIFLERQIIPLHAFNVYS